MNEFRFAEPQFAQLFWLLAAALLLALWLERRGGTDLARFVSVSLQGRLVARPALWRRRLRVTLLGLSAACAILALMRPQWGSRYVVTPRVSAEIMICLDVSKSMLAEDVAPTRLGRAKAEIADLLRYLDGDQVGLIAFAGRASVLSPLTPDFGFLRLVLDSAGAHSVKLGGTRLEEPLRKALAGFGPPGQASRTILLITDGEDHDSFPLDAARAAAEVGVRIIAIGFGDEGGSEILVRDPETGVRTTLLDASGKAVRSRLDGELLRELALLTGGAYIPAGTGVLDLESIYERHIARLVRSEIEGRGRTQRDEAYGWAVLASLLLLLGSAAVASGTSARAPAFTLGLALILAVTPARAEDPNAPAPDDATPRETYNRGLGSLHAGDLDAADRWLGRARREARDDGELRQRASYNLGLVASARSTASEPEEALPALEEAASWFRRAVQLDPEDEDARHNLEVTLLRALVLADELARKNEADLSARLAELAERQRTQTAQVATLLEAGEVTVDVDEAARRVFRELATAQRAILSDTDALASGTAGERDVLPEGEEMRGVQLANTLHYLHRARERMGQSRSQLRERQGERAYRRSAAALDELKRAIDQLRDPVAVLDAILREATRVAVETGARAQAASLGADAPAWLTSEYLAEGQTSVAERTAELSARLRAGLEGGIPEEPEQQRLLDAAREAEPLVEHGREELAAAAGALQSGDLPEAMTRQREAVLALLDARERFLDLRGLIEASYAEQSNVSAQLAPEEDEIDLAGPLRAQRRNLERAGRLAGELGREGESLAADAPEREVFESAGSLLTLARGEMDDAERELAGERRTAARAPAERARVHLESLRRLFFSIVEHLRETADRQVELGDETRDATALDGDPAPLAPRQARLAARSHEIASVLEEQSRSAAAPDPGDAGDAGDAAEQSRKLRQAGEHVLAAEAHMGSAAAALESDPKAAAEPQAHAVEELAAALALLSPPQDPQQQEGDQQQQQGEAQPAGEEDGRNDGSDPAQLLQEVRDREAERRRDRDQRSRSRYESVEKDW